ncbi:MAG TPA: hypothetical protein VG276_28655 [Actinomycetes bacterium]|jgi:hypothetical protein|nr:hypothetical protein [Actinomycetes bacterium]
MATRIRVSTGGVEVRGPMFDGRDVPIMNAFFRDAKKLVTDAGEEQVRQRVNRRAKHPTNSFASAVTTKDFAKGKTIIADYPQVLYGPWLEGTSSRNASTRFKGYKLFRLTRNWLRKHLTAIIQERLDRAVAELNGGH